MFHFDPPLKLMSTVDDADGAWWVNTKGAPDVLLDRCATALGGGGEPRPLDRGDARGAARRGRAVGTARPARPRRRRAARAAADEPVPGEREDAERDLCFVGLVALLDPPRADVAEAVARCYAAGIRIIVVTGDHGLTAAEVARRVGIAPDGAARRDRRRARRRCARRSSTSCSQAEGDLIFARTLARGEAADRRRPARARARRRDDRRRRQRRPGAAGAPTSASRWACPAPTSRARRPRWSSPTTTSRPSSTPSRRAGASTTTSASSSSTSSPTRRAEVVPFLVFALSGGAVPLPLTAVQILAVDLGTETLPALALGRDPAEPGIMERPPRQRGEGVIERPLLVRAWLFLGMISAALVMAGFFFVLLSAGWSPGDAVGTGTPLHHAYLQATTMTFLGIVACQVGTAFAARTDRASLRDGRRLQQPAAAVGHRVRARVHGGAHLRPARCRTCSGPQRSRSTPSSSSCRSRSSSGAPTRSGAG